MARPAWRAYVAQGACLERSTERICVGKHLAAPPCADWIHRGGAAGTNLRCHRSCGGSRRPAALRNAADPRVRRRCAPRPGSTRRRPCTREDPGPQRLRAVWLHSSGDRLSARTHSRRCRGGTRAAAELAAASALALRSRAVDPEPIGPHAAAAAAGAVRTGRPPWSTAPGLTQATHRGAQSVPSKGGTTATSRHSTRHHSHFAPLDARPQPLAHAVAGRSVEEVAAAGEVHGQPSRLRRCNDRVVAHRAAWLHHGAYTARCEHL